MVAVPVPTAYTLPAASTVIPLGVVGSEEYNVDTVPAIDSLIAEFAVSIVYTLPDPSTATPSAVAPFNTVAVVGATAVPPEVDPSTANCDPL